MSKRWEERREYRSKGWVYLLDDEERTAWIIKGKIGRCKTFRLSETLLVDGTKYTIESVEMEAFNISNTLKHLIIPDSFVYVDADTFILYPNLQSVYIGKGLTSLDSSHFFGCHKLKTIVISKENPHIKIANNLVLSCDEKRVFRALRDNDHYTIPESIVSIDEIAFWNNRKLQDITFSSSTRKMGDEGLQQSNGLNIIRLPEGLEEIGQECFNGCKNITHVELPSTLKKLGIEAFYGCDRLKSLTIKTKHVFKDDEFEMCLCLPDDCTIHVPASLLQAYKADDFWHIYNIKEIEQ